MDNTNCFRNLIRTWVQKIASPRLTSPSIDLLLVEQWLSLQFFVLITCWIRCVQFLFLTHTTTEGKCWLRLYSARKILHLMLQFQEISHRKNDFGKKTLIEYVICQIASRVVVLILLDLITYPRSSSRWAIWRRILWPDHRDQSLLGCPVTD